MAEAEEEVTTYEETTETEVVTYPEWAGDDEQRRAFVLNAFACVAGEMSEEIFGAFLRLGERYLETGEVPKAAQKPKSKLQPV